MLQNILNIIGRLVSCTDTMFPFPDFPGVSLLKMIIGLAALFVVICIFTGEGSEDE